MAEQSFQHSEAFLQWIWENLLFDITALKTTCGLPVNLIQQGKLNRSDGPDFTQAAIEIDGITWHGDVEIHTQSAHWKAHGHHQNPDFNTVVLHVVVEEAPQQVQTENGARPYTLNLKPCLSPQLHVFLHSFKQSGVLPCASSLQYISEEAFYKQLERAHTEYFEKKSDDFLRHYDPELLPSKAWKQALVFSVWDGLGISHNRRAMQLTAKKWLEVREDDSLSEDVESAFVAAGFEDALSKIRWNYKGVRPASHPRKRIPEAVKISRQILAQPFKDLLHPAATVYWQDWLDAAKLRSTSRHAILFGTVYLPALYVLGNLYASDTLKKSALQCWKNLQTPVPKSLLRSFQSLGLSDKSYQKKLGSVHQLQAYCEAGRCSKCFVLKKAIQS